MKRSILYVVLFLGLVVNISAFSYDNNKMEHSKGMMSGQGSMMHDSDMDMKCDKVKKSHSISMFHDLIGASSLIERYNIQKQRVLLDAKEMQLENKQKILMNKKRIMELSKKFKADKTVKTELLDLIQQSYILKKRIKRSDLEASKKIQVIMADKEAAINQRTEEWMRKISNDDEELEKFTEMHMMNSHKKNMNKKRMQMGSKDKGNKHKGH